MINKEFVPHELALELKQLGFDEPCFGVYATKDGYVRKSAYGENGDAPTYSQAFRWFRENHDLQYWLSDGGILGKCFVKITGFKHDKIYLWSSEPSEYEEAELACLKKLISLVKK